MLRMNGVCRIAGTLAVFCCIAATGCQNKLQDEKKRTQINADDALKVVFNGKKSVTMFEMTKLVSGHVKA